MPRQLVQKRPTPRQGWQRPAISPEIVKALIKAGGFTAEQASAIETSLARLCDVFEWELEKLKYYSGDQQLEKGLTDVITASAKLLKVLQRTSVRHALVCQHVREGESSELLRCRERADQFDESVDYVLALLQRNAQAARDSHDQDVKLKSQEGRSPLPKDPAAKPEIDALVASIIQEWRELERKDSDPGRTAFAQTILEWMLDKEIRRDTVRSQLRRITQSPDAKIDD